MSKVNPSYDPDEVKQLRGELLRAGLAIMLNKPEVDTWSVLKKEYILKVGSRVLPVLNAGRDDEEKLYPEPIYGGQSSGKIKVPISRHYGNKKNIQIDEEN